MDQLILRLGVALAIGLLVGLERGWRERDEPAGSRTAGLRTFGIIGLLGGIFAALSLAMAAPSVLAAGFLGFAALFGLFEYHEAQHDQTFSATGLIAGLAVFALGGLAVAGDYRIAAGSGAALAAILGSRDVLHRALKKLQWNELRSALMLAVMTTVILPLLPNRAIDPWGGFNPWEVWFFTVLIATISFIGYIAVRVLGPTRGFLVSGLGGALVSSTAVTVALARMTRRGDQALPLAGAAALAGMVSVLRVTAVVLILAPGLFGRIAPVSLTGAGVLALTGALLLSRGPHDQTAADGIRNPFELRALLVFAALFALVSTVSAALVGRFGGSSLVVTSMLSGMFDADVAVLSALRSDPQALGAQVIAAAVLGALTSNACGRLVLAALAGTPRFWLPLAGATLLAVAAGAGVYALRLVP
ncbi:MAG: MgtC/SapB family protein [Pseudodonghicola sp.]